MANARILRRARLTGREDFQRVFQSAVKLENSCLKILARHNSRGYPRLGLAIPKKWVKSAVARNRIKRIVRESFRLNQHRLGAWDIVVLGRASVDAKSGKELRFILEKHWSKLVDRCASSSSC